LKRFLKEGGRKKLDSFALGLSQGGFFKKEGKKKGGTGNKNHRRGHNNPIMIRKITGTLLCGGKRTRFSKMEGKNSTIGGGRETCLLIRAISSRGPRLLHGERGKKEKGKVSTIF